MPSQNVFNEPAPAKINLTLRVLGRRPDGYRELSSLIAFADEPVDVVSFKPGAMTSLRVCGPFADRIAGENILARAFELSREVVPQTPLGLIELEKNLPVAAGIGSGSSNAAALLRILQRHNGSAGSPADWRHLAQRLGSDVPVCFESPTAAIVGGRGEQIDAIDDFAALTIVLVNPMVQVPPDKTAQVFSNLSAETFSDMGKEGRCAGNFNTVSDVLSFMRLHGNDLEKPARLVVPHIGRVILALEAQRGCQIARLSGAGPTCFGIFESRSLADVACEAIRKLEPSWWVHSTSVGAAAQHLDGR